MSKIKISIGDTSGLLQKISVFIDGKKVDTIKSNNTDEIEVSAGKHVISFKDSGLFSNSKKYEFKLNQNEDVFISINTGNWKYNIQISYNNLFSDDGTLLVEKSNELDKIINLLPKNEKVELAMKGTFREYLICTDKKVYIVKKGFMTGHFFGNDNFNILYSRITNVEIDFHLMSGYFEISTGGLENKKLNYWSTDANSDPSKQPNCISLNNECRKKFEIARNFIFDKMDESSKANNVPNNSSKTDVATQIRDFKKLYDDGIITKEEFEKKKKQLLNL